MTRKYFLSQDHNLHEKRKGIKCTTEKKAVLKKIWVFSTRVTKATVWLFSIFYFDIISEEMVYISSNI